MIEAGELTLILSKFEDLRRRKSYAESRKLSLRVIADESGVSLGTVHRISSGSTEGVRLTTLDALSKYFGVLSISELIEYVPDEAETQRDLEDARHISATSNPAEWRSLSDAKKAVGL